MALWSLAARAGIPAARSALRFLSKMKKPKGITLYRGTDAKNWLSKAETAKMYNPSKIPSKFDFNDPELRKKFGTEGRKTVLEIFNWDKLATEFIKIVSKK